LANWTIAAPVPVPTGRSAACHAETFRLSAALAATAADALGTVEAVGAEALGVAGLGVAGLVVGCEVVGVPPAEALTDGETLTAGEAVGAEPVGVDCAGFGVDSVGWHAVTTRAAETTTAAATAFLTPPPAPLPVARRRPFTPLPLIALPFMPSPEISVRRGRSPPPYCSAAQTKGPAHRVRPITDL
jgi:hypothetical protein